MNAHKLLYDMERFAAECDDAFIRDAIITNVAFIRDYLSDMTNVAKKTGNVVSLNEARKIQNK